MSTEPTPLLTICLPTMNRPKVLELGLINLAREVEALGDAVEILVTDNGFGAADLQGRDVAGYLTVPKASSADRTVEEIVRGVSSRIRYVRVPGAPVTFARSFLFGPLNHARGEYIWVVGDDDMVIHGAVARVLEFLRANPDLDYVYLNHGWLHVDRRNQQIREHGDRMPENYQQYFSNDLASRRLPRMEDVVALSVVNAYAIFSTIFCYVARRRVYPDHAGRLLFTDNWADCLTNFSGIFPHTHLTMMVFAGRPVGYIGEPCIAQGASNSDDRAWAYKSMIHGHLRLFEWLRDHSTFDGKVLAHLLEALALMAGRLMARIHAQPEDHLGVDIIREQSLPTLITYPCFLDGFSKENRALILLDHEVSLLRAQWERWSAASTTDSPRVAVWDSMRRGMKLAQAEPGLAAALTVAVSSNDWDVWPSGVMLQPPSALATSSHDVLVLAVPREKIRDFLSQVVGLLKAGTPVLTLEGAWHLSGGEWQPILAR